MKLRCLFVLVGGLVTVAACGSSTDDSVFSDPNGAGASSSGDQGVGGTHTTSGPIGDGGACATVSTEAKLTPVNLVVMFDRSGSMGDTTEDPSFDPKLRWIPVGQAMKAFFSDAASSGMKAELTFFPSTTNSCQASDYETPQVTLTSLPSNLFAQAIDGTSPKGDTPTRAAALGAITQAQAILKSAPTEKTVIVFVTDGEPYGCGITTDQQSDAEAQAVAQEVGKVKAQIATYVIGVGPSVQNLDAIATAGGTTAFHVDVGNSQQTEQQLEAAMTSIRGALGRCDFDIPAPPDGRTLDFDKVNVEKITGAGVTETLPYVADCAGGNGWHYDDAQNPKKVMLCSATCDAVKADANGKVNVSFSCVDRPDAVH